MGILLLLFLLDRGAKKAVRQNPFIADIFIYIFLLVFILPVLIVSALILLFSFLFPKIKPKERLILAAALYVFVGFLYVLIKGNFADVALESNQNAIELATLLPAKIIAIFLSNLSKMFV